MKTPSSRTPSTRKDWWKKFREKESSSLEVGSPALSVPAAGEGAWVHRSVVEVSPARLVANYRILAELAGSLSLLPMLKANAYGHGAGLAAQALRDVPRLYGFGLATFEEAVQLRHSLSGEGRRIALFVFSEAAGWTDGKGALCEAEGLTPILSSWEDLERFISSGWQKRISYELKFNTGLNRLGIDFAKLGAVRRILARLSPGELPGGICSHLASSEDPAAKLSRLQLERFLAIRSELNGVAPAAQFHLSNSGGLWNSEGFRLTSCSDVVRPGLSLYGVPPWPGASARGLLPVLKWSASVVAVHTLKAGDSLGYGGTFTVPRSQTAPVRVAILSAGYADGIQRQWSGSSPGGGGWVFLGGKPERFLGRVSMDLSAVSCGPRVKVGDQAEIFGENVDPWAQARAADTIPYEIFTSIGSRVMRRVGK
jgi:alanine racemase